MRNVLRILLNPIAVVYYFFLLLIIILTIVEPIITKMWIIVLSSGIIGILFGLFMWYYVKWFYKKFNK